MPKNTTSCLPQLYWHTDLNNIRLPTGYIKIRPWLTLTDSLTQYLQNQGKQIQANYLNESIRQATTEEWERLSLKANTTVHIREVTLYANKQPYMFARSIFPPVTWQTHQHKLAKLGNKPLGPIIFKDQNLQRSPFRFTLLSQDHLDYQLATKHLNNTVQELIARDSIFLWKNTPFLLYEVFYPTNQS